MHFYLFLLGTSYVFIDNIAQNCSLETRCVLLSVIGDDVGGVGGGVDSARLIERFHCACHTPLSNQKM